MNTKLLNVLTDAEVAVINEVARNFMSLSDEEVIKNLWNLTYRPDFALEKMGISEYPTFRENFKKIRKEIFEQSGHSAAITIEDTEENKALFNALQSDKFAFWRIYNAISTAVIELRLEDLKRISYLLNSESTKKRFGGLRSLKLYKEEADYFLTATPAIATYFDAKFTEVKNNLGVTEEKGDENVDEVIKPTEEENVAEHSDEIKATEEENDDKIIKIIRNKSDLTNFYEYYDYFKGELGSQIVDMILKPETFEALITFLSSWAQLKEDCPAIDFSIKEIMRRPSYLTFKAKQLRNLIEKLNKEGIDINCVLNKENVIKGMLTL